MLFLNNTPVSLIFYTFCAIMCKYSFAKARYNTNIKIKHYDDVFDGTRGQPPCFMSPNDGLEVALKANKTDP